MAITIILSLFIVVVFYLLYVSCSDGTRAELQVFRRAFKKHVPTILSALRSQVDNPVGTPDDVEVVLNDDHRVAGIDELADNKSLLVVSLAFTFRASGLDSIIPWMETDAGLV